MTTFSDAFAALGEAFRRTTPGFVLLFSGITVVGYGVGYVINAATAPITTPGIGTVATWTGALLIVLVGSAMLAMHTALAQTWATHAPPALSDALDALPSTLRTLPILLLVGLSFLALATFFRQFGVGLFLAFWLWTGPVVIQHVVHAHDVPLHRALREGFGHAFRSFPLTLPLALLVAGLLYLGAITFVGLLYVLPLLTLAHAIAYRDSVGL